MAFFSQMGVPGAGMGTGGGSPSAFTSPGMDPMSLALLLRMQQPGGGAGAGGGMIGAPQIPMPPTNPGAGIPMMGGAGGGGGANASPQQQNILQMLQGLSAINPQGLRGVMSMMGIGNGGGTGVQSPAFANMLNALPNF